jgi:hypothetical protein
MLGLGLEPVLAHMLELVLEQGLGHMLGQEQGLGHMLEQGQVLVLDDMLVQEQVCSWSSGAWQEQLQQRQRG